MTVATPHRAPGAGASISGKHPHHGAHPAPSTPPPLSAHEYAAAVLDGRIPACRLIMRACERWRHDLATADARGLVFDPAAAAHAIAFARMLRHSKGEWRGQRLVLDGWQRFIVANLFGWRWRATGLRRFKKFYIEIPRKNGKSTLLSYIALYMMVADGEGGPECYTVANSIEQAHIVFGESHKMVRASRALNSRIACYRGELTIENRGAVLKALHSKSETLDGLSPHFWCFDEFHEANNRRVVDKLETATGARKQALGGIITTAGEDIESPCYKERAACIRLLNGEAGANDDATFVFIAAIDDADDWTSELTWAKCNPSLGVCRYLQNMREDFAKARRSLSDQAIFLRYYLNKWTNEQIRWLRLDDWRSCRSIPLTLDDLSGRVCFGGMDLASSQDTNALAFYFPELFALYLRFFIPRDNMLERERRDHVPFSEWVQQGWICATPGNITDTDFIREEARRCGERFKVQEIAFDRAYATTIVTQLGADGFTMVPMGQGMVSMTAPSKEFEKLVLAHRLWHGGNPVLSWMAGHVCVERDAHDGIKPSKGASFERIDGIAASVMALGRAMLQPIATESVYEKRGVVVL